MKLCPSAACCNASFKCAEKYSNSKLEPSEHEHNAPSAPHPHRGVCDLRRPWSCPGPANHTAAASAGAQHRHAGRCARHAQLPPARSAMACAWLAGQSAAPTGCAASAVAVCQSSGGTGASAAPEPATRGGPLAGTGEIWPHRPPDCARLESALHHPSRHTSHGFAAAVTYAQPRREPVAQGHWLSEDASADGRYSGRARWHSHRA